MKKEKLTDITLYLKRGISPHYVEDEGFNVLNQKCVRDHRVDFNESQLTSYSKKYDSKKFLLRNDVLINSTGTGTLGRTARYNSELTNVLADSHMTITRPDPSKVDPIFFGYLLGSIEENIESLARGATNQMELSSVDLGKMKVPLPDKNVQISIAKYSNIYDGLIENNIKRIKILEKATLYKFRNWFLRRDYPGRGKIGFSNSLPTGWNVKRIADVCQTIGGGTPSTEDPDYWEDGDIVWFSPTDITNNDSLILLDSEKKITRRGLLNSSAKILPDNAILMTSRASIGFFGIFDQPCCTNQGFISIVPNENWMRLYLLFNLMSRTLEIEAWATGSTFMEISKGDFRKFKVIVPPKELLQRFELYAGRLLKKARVLAKTNRALKYSRDILLPRLLNGTIKV